VRSRRTRARFPGASRGFARSIPDEGMDDKLDPPDASFELHPRRRRREVRPHDGPHDEEKGCKTAPPGHERTVHAGGPRREIPPLRSAPWTRSRPPRPHGRRRCSSPSVRLRLPLCARAQMEEGAEQLALDPLDVAPHVRL